MSDVPELDRLIEEHENFRRNVRWDRMDRIFYAFMSAQIFVAISLVAFIILGWLGLALVPLVWSRVKGSMPKPAYRDPFRRYAAK